LNKMELSKTRLAEPNCIDHCTAEDGWTAYYSSIAVNKHGR
ncbi:hypothetical protein AVEN_248717-2-1, partial [Araneus ventricosus]